MRVTTVGGGELGCQKWWHQPPPLDDVRLFLSQCKEGTHHRPSGTTQNALSPYLLKVFLGFGVLQFSRIFAHLMELQTFILNTPQWKQKPEAYHSRHLQKSAKHVTALAVLSAGFAWMACWWGGCRYAFIPRRQSPALLLTAAFIWW